MQNLITKHLDIWTSAHKTRSTAGRGGSNKLDLYGIKKLRELIYSLAANGTLIPSNRESEHSKLSDVTEFIMGQAPAGSECNTDGIGTIFVKTGEFGKLFPEVKEWTTKPLKMARKGDVLICVVGATIGKLNFGIDCAIGRSVAAIRPKIKITTEYLYISLVPFTLKLRQDSRGSAQGVIGKAELSAVEIRVPNLEEQHRIAAKVDELMAFCDQLEQTQSDNIAAHAQLVEALLATLTNSSDHNELQTNWQRIAAHFDTLFTTEHSIDQLKQTILQLAVMGKLAPQNPNDEPASELLKKIAAEKAQLIKEGKIKKEKPLPEITDEEKPFELPSAWEWARIGNSALSTDYGISDKSHEGDVGVPVLAMGHIQNGEVILGNQKVVSPNIEALPELYLKNRDLLYNRTNSAELVGKTGIYRGNDDEYTFASYLIRISTTKDTQLPEFLNLNMLSPQFRITQINPHLKQQCGQANVNGTIMKSMLVAIAPESEIERILHKVDELMALCDTLKTNLQNAQTTQLALADALVKQAVG